MKKLLLSLLLLFTLGLAAQAQGSADFNTFNNGNANSSYSTYTSTKGWKATNSAIVKIGSDLAPTLNGKTTAVGTLTSPSLSGGISKLTFSYENTYKETKGVKVQIEIKVNGKVVKTDQLANTSVTQKIEYTYSWSDINIVDDFTIVITNLSPSNSSSSNKDRVSIFNLSWEGYTDNPDDTRETFSFEGFKSYTIPAGESVNYNPALPEKKPTNIEYTSTDEEVATADNADVHAYKVGTATITASWKDDAVFKDGSATFTVTVVDAAKSIAELLEKAPNKDDKVYVNFPMTVTYANGLYGYVTDGNGGFTMLYGDYNLADKDIIPAGWTAVNSLYNGLEEYTVDGSLPAITEKGTFTPREVTLAEVTEDIMNEIVIIKGVNFASATLSDKSSNFDGTNGGATLQFRNNFLIASVEAGTYNVLAAVGYFNGTVQAYPIEYMPVNKLVDDYVLVETTLHPKAGRVTVEYMFDIENWDGSEPQYDVQVFVNGTNVNATEVKPTATAKAAAENAKTFVGKLIYEADALKNAAKEDVKVKFKATVGKTVAAVESTPSTTTGIEDVTVDGNAEAEYFNLQGLRVAQPEAGQLYIKRQGGKAVKVRF